MQQNLMIHYNQYVEKAFLWHRHQQGCDTCLRGEKMSDACSEIFVNYKLAKKSYLDQLKECLG